MTMESVAGLPLNTLLSVVQVRDRNFSEALILYGCTEVAVALACVYAHMDDAAFRSAASTRWQRSPVQLRAVAR
ncbi:hypothetical protein [Myxococcus fulvus]|uniref:hypothetical protein n=1 Tax=Myxococcus fulvus TaxID=33 RepID=UPI0020C00A39|nr:hypothetical protein [Myxococcus fulvus]MCK8503277.1 hypothetical protein [Myxococcus fulvus]